MPLIEHCSNRQFGANLDTLLQNGEVPITVRHKARHCQCGCDELVTGRRQYVNQDYYTVWLTHVQYPQWREKRSRRQ